MKNTPARETGDIPAASAEPEMASFLILFLIIAMCEDEFAFGCDRYTPGLLDQAKLSNRTD